MDGLWIAVIGGGVMGRAIIEGGVRAGVLRAEAVGVAEPDPGRRGWFEAMGCVVGESAGEVVGACDRRGAQAGVVESAAIVLAVKPQMFESVGEELGPVVRAGGERHVVSIMAGVRAGRIAERLGERARVVRAMPNTPGRIGQGVTGIAAGPGATEADVAMASRLFAALGPVVERIEESLMDAFTAVAGSGPAYLFYLAEAMERAARAVGFEPAMARRVVGQTLRGAAGLLENEAGADDPAVLRAAVTSKGGTTAAAIASLEAAGVMEAWVGAIVSARDRGRELGAG